MASGTRVCKVCGKEYEYCHTLRRTNGIYRWQDVACCEEHGRKYLADIIASRNEEATKQEKAVDVEKELKVTESPEIHEADAVQSIDRPKRKSRTSNPQ